MSGFEFKYTRSAAVTKSDSTVLNCKGFFVGGAGNVAIQSLGTANIADGSPDAAVTLTGCTVGTMYEIPAYRIMSTNTTATNIIAFW